MITKERLHRIRGATNLASLEFFAGGQPEIKSKLRHFNIYYPIQPNFCVPEVNFDSDNGGEIFEDWLHENYRYVVSSWAWDLENLYVWMQGENWSPNGEARELIRGLGLKHTSMSIGDIIEDTETGQFHIVDFAGFRTRKLSKKGWE